MDQSEDRYGMPVQCPYSRADGHRPYQPCTTDATCFVSDNTLRHATYSHGCHHSSTNDNHSQYSTSLPPQIVETTLFTTNNEIVWGRDYGSPGRHQLNLGRDVTETLKLFPFVCGLCYAKFSHLVEYYFHFTTHTNCMNKYFHCCDTDQSAYRETSQAIFSCPKCDFVSPTLCLLHEHLDKVEHLTWYKINVLTKRVYHASMDERSEQACNSETFDLVLDTDSDKKDMNDDDGTDTNVRINTTQICNVFTVKQESSVVDAAPDVRKESQQYVNNEINDFSESELEETQSIGDKSRHAIKSEESDIRKTNSALKQTKPKIRTWPLNRPKRKGQPHLRDISSRISKQKNPVSNKHTSRMMKDATGKPVYANNTFLPCDKCGAIVQRSKINVHMICHRETRDFPCEQCDYRGKSSFSLKQHVRMVHPLENNFTCQTCGKSFKNNLYLKQHTNTHSERDKQCQVCPQTFTTMALLRRHMLVHQDEKLYKCQQCDKTFTFKGNLNSHVRTVHNDERDFTCTQCGKTFKIMHALKKHMKTHEPHQYFCSVCDKSFVTAFNMKIHMKVHDINIPTSASNI